MKFNIKNKNLFQKTPKYGSGEPVPDSNLARKDFITIKTVNNDADPNSRATKTLFSIRTTTKMKRTHHKTSNVQGMNIVNDCLACAYLKAQGNGCIQCELDNLKDQQLAHLNIKSDKNLKKVSLKAIGASFANLFKPNVGLLINERKNYLDLYLILISNLKKRIGRNNQNIETENVQFETPKFSKPSQPRMNTFTPTFTPVTTRHDLAQFPNLPQL